MSGTSTSMATMRAEAEQALRHKRQRQQVCASYCRPASMCSHFLGQHHPDACMRISSRGPACGLQGGGDSSLSGAAEQQGELSAIEQFQAQKEAARKRTNALGQTETGVPMWKVRPADGPHRPHLRLSDIDHTMTI